jgi:hypothetical protein
MAVARLQCPACNAVMTPKKPVPNGAQVKCAKCETIFKAEVKSAAMAPAAPTPSGGDFDFETSSAPTTRPAKKSSGVLKILLLVGGVAVCLVLLCTGGIGIGVYYAFFHTPADETKVAMQGKAKKDADKKAGDAAVTKVTDKAKKDDIKVTDKAKKDDIKVASKDTKENPKDLPKDSGKGKKDDAKEVPNAPKEEVVVWKEREIPYAGFAAIFPGTPDFNRANVRLDSADIAITVSWEDAYEALPLAKATENTFAEADTRFANRKPPHRVLSKKRVPVKGQDVLEMEVEVTPPVGKPYLLKYRGSNHNRRFFHLEVGAPEPANKADIDRFMNSFRILPEPLDSSGVGIKLVGTFFRPGDSFECYCTRISREGRFLIFMAGDQTTGRFAPGLGFGHAYRVDIQKKPVAEQLGKLAFSFDQSSDWGVSRNGDVVMLEDQRGWVLDAKGRTPFPGDNGKILALTFDPALAVTHKDRKLTIHSLNGAPVQVQSKLTADEKTTTVAIAPDGSKIAVHWSRLTNPAGPTVTIHQASDGALVRSIDEPFDPPFTFSHDSQKLIFTDFNGVHVHSLADGKDLRVLPAGNLRELHTLRPSRDGSMLICGYKEGIQGMDLQTGLIHFFTFPVKETEISPNNKFMFNRATGMVQHIVTGASFQPPLPMVAPGAVPSREFFAFLLDGRFILGGQRYGYYLYEMTSRQNPK